jgi:hypothetical protein
MSDVWKLSYARRRTGFLANSDMPRLEVRLDQRSEQLTLADKPGFLGPDE